MIKHVLKLAFYGFFVLSLTACSDTSEDVPKHLRPICHIFEKHPDWYKATYNVQAKYGVPISLQMAIIAQESGFRANAQPKRQKLFGWLPWFRSSTAHGYAQVLDGTWRYYLKKTGQLSANRDYFSDSVAFLGWYVQRIHHELHIPMSNTYALYLAYHEGIHGYQTHEYWRHPKVMKIARKVRKMAWHYHSRLTECGPHLDRLTRVKK